ncbi:MAG: acyl-CoA/acyl-ACP dehydrogenase [Actinobacteria bacterium]|nr:acyl-CoA/acyl-ACP dehydrogenase [Actinomycetota bacterium]
MISDIPMDRGVGGIIHKVCRDFRRNEIEPVALELDGHYDPEGVKSIWRKGFDLDLPSTLVPEEFGGVGHDVLTAAQVLDELAGACAGVAVLFACHLAASLPMVGLGQAKADLLAALAGGEEKEPLMLAVAFPEAFESPERPRLANMGGQLVLEGSAPLVSCASLADRMLIFAGDTDGVSPVVVDLLDPGVSIGAPEELLGLHTLPFCDVAFEGCSIEEDDLLGERGAGAPTLQRTLAVFHGFLAAIAVGTARTAHAAAYRYAQERFQFGKMLIEHHEMRRMLSNMATKLDMGTAGYQHALADEKADAAALASSCASAKVFCTDAAMEIVLDAIQIHGGYGYMKETGLEKIMRDVKMLQLLGGSNRLLEVR